MPKIKHYRNMGDGNIDRVLLISMETLILNCIFYFPVD